MAYWNPAKYKTKSVITGFGDGLNLSSPFAIKETEVTHVMNMDSKYYPVITTRPIRRYYGYMSTSSTSPVFSTKINGMEYCASQVHLIDDNTWKVVLGITPGYLDLSTAISTGLNAKFCGFAAGTNTYVIMMNGVDKLIYNSDSTAAPVNMGDTNTPLTNVFTVHKGRIYAAKNKVLYYSALNKSSDWSTVNDAGNIVLTQAKSDITGIVEYNDKTIVFTEYSMHELYGSGPSNYELIDIEGSIGCISDRSITKCNGKLYWLAWSGVYEYDGSAPRKISKAIEPYINRIKTAHKNDCVAGSQGDYIYLAIVTQTGSVWPDTLLKYDTVNDLWFLESGNFLGLTTVGKALVGADTEGRLLRMRETDTSFSPDVDIVSPIATTPISWEIITKAFTDGAIGEKKTLTDMYLVAEVSTNSTGFSVGYSTNAYNNDSTTFTTLKTLSGSSEAQNDRIQLPLSAIQNVNWYRLRFAGSGKATIHYLQKNLRVKTR